MAPTSASLGAPACDRPVTTKWNCFGLLPGFGPGRRRNGAGDVQARAEPGSNADPLIAAAMSFHPRMRSILGSVQPDGHLTLAQRNLRHGAAYGFFLNQ
jgi:hypothetical protein